MTIPETVGSLVAFGTLLAMAGKGLKALLRSFHNEHVAPSIASVTTAIAHNTEATASLTSALAKSNEAQERGFERMGDIIAEHEKQLGIHATRLDHHDEAIGAIRRPAAAKVSARRKS